MKERHGIAVTRRKELVEKEIKKGGGREGARREIKNGTNERTNERTDRVSHIRQADKQTNQID